ncbi:MAG TPA: hypothetical protein ENH94_07550 [Phycisphaerales bacterium]|nr:hypothetical protein [Phycisphaerales bacterium]
MPNIYVTDETKDLIEKVCKEDKRTQDGEINFLCSERAKELGILAVEDPSSEEGTKQSTESLQESQA